jgi:SAM-dependent methyltransferase
MDRLKLVRQHVDIEHQRGLEIGPLVHPVVTPDLGSIHYADHASTEELRTKYARDPTIDGSAITPVDFVWGAMTLAECAAAAAPFDYVVASHVLEHVPDLIGWLQEIAEVLRPGGRLCLVIPDRRFTFDVRRRPSDVAEMVEAHLLHLRRPALRATFDHFSRHIEVDTGALWRGQQAYPQGSPINLLQGLEAARKAAQTGEYIDTHCWVFSDAEFVDRIGELARMNLMEFRFVGFTPAPVDDLEFFAVLERLDAELSPPDRVSIALASLPGSDAMASAPPPFPDPFDPMKLTGASLSQREVSLIRRKRMLMARARTVVSRIRQRG